MAAHREPKVYEYDNLSVPAVAADTGCKSAVCRRLDLLVRGH